MKRTGSGMTAALLAFLGIADALISANAESDNVLDCNRIEFGVSHFVTSVTAKGKTYPTGLLTRTVTRIRVGEVDAIQSEQREEEKGGISVDTSVADARTLLPITFTSENAGATRKFHREGLVMTGVTTDSKGTKEFTDVTTVPTYNLVMDDEILAALPFKDGFVFRYRTYEPGDAGYDITAAVSGPMRLSVPGGSGIECWIVEQTGGPVPTTTWWFEQRSHALVALRVRTKRGAELWRRRIFDIAPAVLSSTPLRLFFSTLR
jgi:hypothetical protein